MLNLFASLVTLFVSHWVPSHPAIRPQLVERLGLRGFRVAYSILSLAVIAWVILAYGSAWDSPYLWYPPFEMRWLAVVLMPVSIWLVTMRMAEKRGDTPTGVYRLIAAPGSAGFLLWSLLHLANLGQARAILLFGAFAAISLAAYLKNVLSAAPEFRAVGAIPSAAVLSGRQTLHFREFSLQSILIALAIWIALLLTHPYVIGVDPLAGMLSI